MEIKVDNKPKRKRGGSACSVFGCHNGYCKRSNWNFEECIVHVGMMHKDCPCLQPYHFHRFPREENLKRLWINAINRKDFTPKDHSIVCSSHFRDGRPTQINPVPSENLGHSKKVPKGRRPVIRVPAPSKKRQRLDEQVKEETTEVNLNDERIDPPPPDIELPATPPRSTSTHKATDYHGRL